MSGTETVPNWQAVFDAIGVAWTDHGKNVGSGRINIHCPWCGAADPSMHLSLSLDSIVYVCLRNPSHKGGHRPGAIRLLQQLGQHYQTAMQLLDSHPTTNVITISPRGITQSAVVKQWNRFSPAIEFGKMREYLHERGFPNPEVVCQRYDLRFAPHGEWVGRVLFPITENNVVVSWTGRAIYDHIKPKYKIQQVQDTGLLYAPRTTGRVGIIVEGPIDALKINAACEGLSISAAALTGLAVSDWSAMHPERLMRIRNFLQGKEIRAVALDSTVPVADVDRLLKNIAEFQGADYYIYRLPISPGFDDPGEMDYTTIQQWLTDFCNRLGSNTDGTSRIESTQTKTAEARTIHPPMGKR